MREHKLASGAFDDSMSDESSEVHIKSYEAMPRLIADVKLS